MKALRILNETAHLAGVKPGDAIAVWNTAKERARKEGLSGIAINNRAGQLYMAWCDGVVAAAKAKRNQQGGNGHA